MPNVPNVSNVLNVHDVEDVRIVADRFAVTREGRAFDLATGAPVLLRIGVGGGLAEQSRWSARCDVLHKVHHRALARLVDYGALGECRRFEAWQVARRWSGAADDAARTLRAASRFLAACGLTDAGSAADVFEYRGRLSMVPPDAGGYTAADDVPKPVATQMRETFPVTDCGICTIDRAADAVLADLFASLSGSRPHIISVWGPPGSGRRTTALRAARLARANGFIPVSVTVLNRIPGGLLKDRHVCVIDDGGDPGVAVLLSVALASPRAHVLLRLGPEETSGVRLERIASHRLIAAVRPDGLDNGARAEVSRAAALSRGLPARFADLLWHRSSPPSRQLYAGGLRMGSRVAEQPAVYGVGERAPRAWPAPGELAALSRRSEAAVELLARGRHEPGVRQLRQVIGRFSRRGAWAHAVTSALPLASALLARGDAPGALTALQEAKGWAERAGVETALVDLAVTSGHAWIDLGRLAEAESVLATALAAARRMADASRVESASLALGRCLFWAGRYAESTSVLVVPGGIPCGSVLRCAAAARPAVGMGDLSGAMSLAREAGEEASTRGDHGLIARAAGAAAFVHLAIGDMDAVAADVRRAIAAARSAHDPMRAIRARLLLAEADRRRGRPPSPLAARLGRLSPRHLPPILRARFELFRALREGPASARDIARQHASRSGLPALSLLVPDVHHQGGGEPLRRVADSPTEVLVGILHLCQTAEDETRILRDVCARIRRQLHAAVVAVFAREGSGISLVADDGARLDSAIAARAMTADVTIAPHRVDDRLESAAPVRYAGAVIGALAARWPLGTPYDLSLAAGVLTITGTAAAPVLSAAIGRRSRPKAPALSDLLGVASQMSELRRAIERAAAAPFAVLVEGESGSGKELVAKAVHRLGLRRDRPFCTLNCAALPDDLIEAELFGHARGAFTGAVNERAGIFEEAHGGTLFLDEVGELSPRAQAKLLRVIQEGEMRRVGENMPRRVDVRIVSATNRDLRHDVAAGRFRLDLLYRLDVIRLAVPPLRDRREDVAVLADLFWREATARVGSRAVLGAATTAALARYDWPGNVRELQNVLASLAVRSPRRGVVTPAALPPQFAESRLAEACRLDDARRVFEERFVRAALVRSGGHRTRAAAELGVTRQGLTKLLTRLGIDDRRPGTP